MLLLIVFVLVVVSCQSTETEVNLITQQHAALFGTWQDNDTIENTTWVFDQYEVKWKGFSHFYKVSGDSLIISGMIYRILEQKDNQMKLLTLNGKPCTLIRKE